MSRTVPEWRAASHDQPIPPRVKDRVYQKFNGRCAICTLEIVGKLKPEYDHIIPLCNGGEHRESALQLLCMFCHQRKTRQDVALKAKNDRVRKKHAGIKKPRTIRSWRKFNGEIVHAGRARS